MVHKIVYTKRINRLLCLFYIFATLIVAQQLSFIPIFVFCLVSHLQTMYKPNRKVSKKMSLAQIAVEVIKMLKGDIIKESTKTSVTKVINVGKFMRRNSNSKKRAVKYM